MFDLFRSRDKAVRILLGGLLLIVALSMLVYLIPGAGTPTGNRDDQIVVEVGKDAITVQDFDRDIQAKLRGRQIPPDAVGVLIPQEIEQMVAERAAAYQAARMGIRISDAQLADTIRSLPNFGNLTPEQYRDVVAQQGFSVPEFEGNVRKQLMLTTLVNLAMDGVVVAPAEIEREYKSDFQKVKLEYVGFSADKLKAEVKPSPEELKKYFQARKDFYKTPEARSFQFLVADPVKMAAASPVPEAQLRQFYDTHKDTYRAPERVKVRHILFKTQGVAKEEVAKVRAKAEDVLKQIKGGADFAKMAEKYSEDPSNAKNGGDLGWVVRGQMVKEFEEAAFTQKPKEIGNLVTTTYGFHIVQVMEKQEARLQPFDEVKPIIAAELSRQQANDKVQAVTDDARAELAKAPQNGQQIASKYGLQFENVENHKPGEAIPNIGVDPAIDGMVQSLKKGEVSQVTQSGTRLEFAVLTNIVPSHPAEFADVEAQVRNAVIQDSSFRMVNDKAKQAVDMLKTNGGDVAAVAKKLGGEMKTTEEFSRGGAVEGLGPAVQLGEAFDKPVGGIIGPLNIGALTIVAKVVAKVDADMSKLSEQREAIIRQLKSQKSQERAQLFEEGIVNKLTQEGKIKIHKDVMSRLITRYRG
jgi:peptidyl-prolyl cis-trans isomerase D